MIPRNSETFFKSGLFKESFYKNMDILEETNDMYDVKLSNKRWELYLANGETITFEFSPYNFPHAIGMDYNALKVVPYLKNGSASNLCRRILLNKDKIYKDIVAGIIDFDSLFSRDYHEKAKSLFDMKSIELDNITFVCKYNGARINAGTNGCFKLESDYLIGIDCADGFTILGISEPDADGYAHVKTNLAYPANKKYLNNQVFVPVIGLIIYNYNQKEIARIAFTNKELLNILESIKIFVDKNNGYLDIHQIYNYLYDNNLAAVEKIVLQGMIENLSDQKKDLEKRVDDLVLNCESLTEQRNKDMIEMKRIEEENIRLKKTQSPFVKIIERFKKKPN